MTQEERRKMLNELIDTVVGGGDIITTRMNILNAWDDEVEKAFDSGMSVTVERDRTQVQ